MKDPGMEDLKGNTQIQDPELKILNLELGTPIKHLIQWRI